MSDPLSMDQVFINKLTQIVEVNLSDENFNVKKLANAAGMSHATLHRKLKSIRNQDTSEFISEIRLRHAMELLVQNAGTASEIAYRVGFGSPAYFSKCFHDYYGYPPGEVKKRHSGQPERIDGIEAGKISAVENESDSMAKEPSGRKKINPGIVILITVLLVTILLIALYFFVPQVKEYNRSIVVLPFKNISEPKDTQYLADGIMEDILNNLCRVTDLRVISRITAEHFRGKDITARMVARELNARYILESSVRVYDDKARITVQLIDGYWDKHIWSDNFDRKLTDIMGIQNSIATQVALRLKDLIRGAEIQKSDQSLTSSSEAYDNYLRGRFLLYSADDEQRVDISKEGLTGSIQYFEKALAADSNFAEAWAGMAKAYMSLTGWGWFKPEKEGFEKAKTFCMKAMELKPDLAQAHAVKGSVLFFTEQNIEEARKEFLLAIRSKTPYPPVYQPFTQLLMVTGPIEEARIYMNRALTLEPYYWVLHNLNAYIYYFEEKYGKALEACHIAQGLKPDYIFTNWLFFLSYAKSGNGEKAMKELQTIVGKCPEGENYAAEIAREYRRSGIPGLFSWLIDMNINRPLPAIGLSGHPFFIAWWYAILGNREQSLDWLEKTMKEKNKMLVYFRLIVTNPDFDILRNEPRFLSIIEQIGLKPYHTRKSR